ncbi:MAG: N-succinylarginine dihydrolase [Pseudomonadota bacterium]
MKTHEVNFDGLIGPSHNYGGLSDGNLASGRNAGDVSRPKEAALQGLEKMRLLVRSGLKQAVFPPLDRPSMPLLSAAGFGPDCSDTIVRAAEQGPAVLKAAWSASSMWAANAATVSPSADTLDGRLHLSASNLSTMLHRSIEHGETAALLREIFKDTDRFCVHDALPTHSSFADEGAANHVRLCQAHGAEGVELFVYGRNTEATETNYPARQTLLASKSLARRHNLSSKRTVFAKQSKDAIDAGAFHNDVVCVGALDTIFFHEYAFEDIEGTLNALRIASEGLFDLKPVMVPDCEVPLADAVTSYLFNSQLLKWPGEDRLVLLAPTETRDTPSTAAYCAQLVAGNGPIGRVQYVDVRQSMRNGGGPACLRLRVVMTEDEIAAAHNGVFLDDDKIDDLCEAVRATYRDTLSPADLADPEFAADCRTARSRILEVLDLDGL